LNYRRMENNTWFGSVLIVTKGGGLYERPAPVLVIKSSAAKFGQQTNLSINATEEESYGTVNGVDYSSFQGSEANGAQQNGTDSTKGKHNILEQYSRLFGLSNVGKALLHW